jgi:hypothetical protein
MLSPDIEVPDLPYAIEAWRVWRLVAVDGRRRLASFFKWAVWQPGEPLEARCLSTPTLLDRIRHRPGHEAPIARCTCGIYGAQLRLLDTRLTWTEGYNELVVGEVSLWGTVVECEHGFRASLAYPRSIFVPIDGSLSRAEHVANDLSAYGVPVETLPVRGEEAATELRRRAIAAQ